MPIFPRAEAEVYDLARQISDALQDIARGHSRAGKVRGSLEEALTAYRKAVEARDAVNEQLRAANDAKDACLATLVEVTKSAMAAADEMIARLPDAKATEVRGAIEEKMIDDSSRAPALPRDLEGSVVGPGAVELRWRRPQRGRGGRVRTYLIEWAKPGTEGDDAAWTLLSTAYSTDARLDGQPGGMTRVYRVRAENRTGSSPDGPTVTVFIPSAEQ